MPYVNQGHYSKIIKDKNKADECYMKVMEYFEDGNLSRIESFTDMAYKFEVAFTMCSNSEIVLEQLLKNQKFIKEQSKYEKMLSDIKYKKAEIVSKYIYFKDKYINGAGGLSAAEQSTLEELKIDKS